VIIKYHRIFRFSFVCSFKFLCISNRTQECFSILKQTLKVNTTLYLTKTNYKRLFLLLFFYKRVHASNIFYNAEKEVSSFKNGLFNELLEYYSPAYYSRPFNRLYLGCQSLSHEFYSPIGDKLLPFPIISHLSPSHSRTHTCAHYSLSLSPSHPALLLSNHLVLIVCNIRVIYVIFKRHLPRLLFCLGDFLLCYPLNHNSSWDIK
jgi:hypothetical protein